MKKQPFKAPFGNHWLPPEMRGKRARQLKARQGDNSNSGRKKGIYPTPESRGFAKYGSLARTNPGGYARWCQKYDGIKPVRKKV